MASQTAIRADGQSAVSNIHKTTSARRASPNAAPPSLNVSDVAIVVSTKRCIGEWINASIN